MADSNMPTLVTRAQQGDRSAFEKLVHQTARLVYAQIVASVRDRQKAEDLTQETFVAAWKGIGNLQVGERGILTWLLTLARNKVLDAAKFEGRLKRGGAVVPTPSSAGSDRSGLPALSRDPADLPDHAPSPAESAQHAEDRQHALAVLEELPEEYRRPLAMRYLAGADYQTICRALEISDGALRGLLTRGMALMRERMTRLDTDKVTQ